MTQADRVLAGTAADDVCGTALDASDLDGDGAEDLAVGRAQRNARDGPARRHRLRSASAREDAWLPHNL